MKRTIVSKRNVALGILLTLVLGPATALAATSSMYTFNVDGTVVDAASLSSASGNYLWLNSGGKMIIQNGVGKTIQGALKAGDPLQVAYARSQAVATDNGSHPQNIFQLFRKQQATNVTAQIDVNRVADNLSNAANRHGYNAESLLVRYKDANNFYFGSIRADGNVVIKKKTNGVYQTLATKKVLSGTYDANTNYDLMPKNTWMSLKLSVTDNASGGPTITFSTDIGRTGSWTQQLSVVDDSSKFGAPISGAGIVGIQSDFADLQLDNFAIADSGTSAPVPAPTPPPAGGPTPTSTPTTTPPTPTPTPPPAGGPTPTGGSNYDSLVLSANPVLFLAMNSGSTGSEKDLSGRGATGTYKGGTPTIVTLPNGEKAAGFNGSSQYLTVPSSASYSIPTTGKLTWEAWIRPDTLQFPNASGDGYIDWMGKCQDYSPSCEWESRMYSKSTPQGRENRLSAYAFNPSAGLGSGADWQPTAGLMQVSKWIHVVGEYDLTTTPSGCSSSYPGSLNIWVNGVKWNQGAHSPTGCMSQYKVTPKAGNSPLNIATMSFDTWFKGAVGKVAIYNRLLTQDEITAHFKAMTGTSPSGSCGATCTAAIVQ